MDGHSTTQSAVPAQAFGITRDTRGDLARELLRGSGLEIGARHLALAVPPEARVRYVDRMTVDDLRAHYPELAGRPLAPVDVVDDGERLSAIAAESVDFIVANHFLEHCEDPIQTIETHLGKLRPGGILFYAVPDKRYTFDFHAWTQSDLLTLVTHLQKRLESFEIEAVRRHGPENIVVLRKHGEPILSSPPRAIPRLSETRANLSNLSQRIYLTYRYQGLASVIYRSLTFPLRCAPVRRALRR